MNPHLWWEIGLIGVICAIPLVGWIAQIVLGPILTHRHQNQPLTREYEVCEIADLPPDFAAVAAQSAFGLAAQGFTAAAHLLSRSKNGRTLCHVSIWTNRTLGDLAEVINVRVIGSAATRTSSLVTFITRYSDGSSINTANTKTPGIFRRQPKSLLLRVPFVADVGMLYRIHRARVDRLGKSRGSPNSPAQGREIEDHQERSRRTMTWQVECGYYYVDQSAGQYRPTWKGAILMTWRLVQPIKALGMARTHLSAKRDLRRLRLWAEVAKARDPLPLPPVTFSR